MTGLEISGLTPSSGSAIGQVGIARNGTGFRMGKDP